MVCLFSMCSRGFEGHENDKFFIYKTCEKKRSKRSQIVGIREALSARAALLFDQEKKSSNGFENLTSASLFAAKQKIFSRQARSVHDLPATTRHIRFTIMTISGLYELRRSG
jgi:hypothetical protein